MVIPEGYKQTEIGVIPEDWECLPLLSKCNLLNGLTYTPNNIVSNGLLVLRSSNIQNNRLSFIDNVYVDLKVDDEKLIQKDDIIICVRNGSAALIGKCAQASRAYPVTFGAFMAVLRGKSNNYIFQLLQQGTIQRHISKNSGATINQITNGDFKEIFVPFPLQCEEQDSIAEALSDVDSMITSLEKLIEKKKAIKQGAMQELLTGKKRLPGFSGEWKKRKLKDLLTVGHGQAQHDVEDVTGRYPILATGGEIGRTNSYLYDRPSVLIGRKGTIDKPQYMETPFWTIDTLFYTKINIDYDAKFIFYVFCLINWLDYNEASGVPSLSATTIENIDVIVPILDEQTAIASILSDMDSEIEVLEQKLTKTRQLKQGMMQQLLTGKIRLV